MENFYVLFSYMAHVFNHQLPQRDLETWKISVYYSYYMAHVFKFNNSGFDTRKHAT